MPSGKLCSRQPKKLLVRELLVVMKNSFLGVCVGGGGRLTASEKSIYCSLYGKYPVPIQ